MEYSTIGQTELKKQGKTKAIGIGSKDWKIINKVMNMWNLIG